MARIYGAASEFIAGEPAGQLTPVRFDVALVDGSGQIRVIENAFAG
jgi:putative endonuclease